MNSTSDGFVAAVEVLGRGFLTHPANRALRRKLSSGVMTPRAYREHLMILAYRIVLLLAADDRQRLGSILAGGWPFDDELADLDGCELGEGDLPAAIRLLTPVPDAAALAAAHEEMLAAEPALNMSERGFAAVASTGSQRKHTGSYYTPEVFVESLLDSALEPVMEAAVERARSAGGSARQIQRRIESALLGLRICDPACGAGHFLVAAARRLAQRLATERAGGKQAHPPPPPGPPLVKGGKLGRARVDVVTRCIYGVDISRTAAELCKLALRLELLGTGVRRLPDLSARIMRGNALTGDAPGLDGAAFDVAIGNPPYRAAMTAREKQIVRRRFPLAAPTSNSAADFVELCTRITRPDGRVGLVVPKSLTYSYSWRRLREAIAPGVVSVIDVRRGWDDVLLEQVLLTFGPGRRRTSSIAVGALHGTVAKKGRLDARLIERLGILPARLSRDEVKLLEVMLRDLRGTLGDICTTRRGSGLQRMLRPDGDIPVLGGRDIAAFGRVCPRTFVRSAEVQANAVRWTRPPQVIFQNIIAHVTRPVEHIRLIGTVARERVACLDTVNLLTIREPAISPAGLCALLMSELVGWFVYACVYNRAVRTMHFDGYFLGKIPVPEVALFGALGGVAERLAGEPERSDNWLAMNEAVCEAYRVPARLRAVVRTT